MDYKKGITINLILIFILSVLLIIVFLPGKKRDAELAYREFELLQYHVYDIIAVAVINEKSRFGLIHKDGRISLEPAPQGAVLSTETLQSYLFRFSKLISSGTVSHPGDKSVYGLETPRAQVSLFLTNGKKVRLFLGAQNQMDGSYYLSKENDDTVYLLAESDADLFLSEPSAFMASRIFPQLDFEDLNQLKFVELTFSNSTLPSFKIENRGNFTFKMAKPYANTIDYEKTLSELIFPVLTLSSGTPEVLPKLFTPKEKELSLKIKLNDKIFNLFFFRKSCSLYMGREGIDDILKLDKEMVPFLNLHYLDLFNGSIYHCNVSEIEGVVIQDLIGNRDYNISLSGQSVNLQGTVNGVSVAYPEMMAFFRVLLKTGIARELSEPMDQNQDVILRIRIYKKNGSMDQLDFAPAGEGRQFLYINGTAHFSTYNMIVVDIQRALSELVKKER